MLQKFKRHYHWVIAAVALLQMMIFGGAVNNFSSYHMIPVTEALGISRTAFSLAVSVRAVLGVVCTFFSGKLIQRFGYRGSTAAALTSAAVAYVLFATMRAYWMLVVGCVLMGFAHGMCLTAGISRLLNGWFHKYRGTVLGIVTAASGAGTTVLGFLQAAAIENVSWRMSFAEVAGLQFLLAVLVFALVRDVPERVGLRPFGDGEVLAEKKTKRRNSAWGGFSMDVLQKRPAYYLMCVCAFCSGLCILATQYIIVPFFQDCGMSVTRTSKLYGIMMLVLTFVKLFMGVMCDAIGAKRVILICHIACALGLTMIITLPQTDAAMIGALIIYDLGLPMTTMMFPLLSGDLFGNRAQSQYIGAIMAMTTAGNIISEPLANAVFDWVGSYRPVFWGCIILALAMIPVYCVLFGMVGRDRRKLYPESCGSTSAEKQ